MNHLVLSYPRDERLLPNAKAYFGEPTAFEQNQGFSFAFFSSDRSFFREPIDGVCVCGNTLNPEDLDRLFSEQAFDELDGVCVAARASGSMVDLVTDRLGFHPLYRFSDGHRIVFSTMLDFLALNYGPLSVDHRAWSDLFTYGFCLNNRSPFKEIKRVGHGVHIQIAKGGVTTRRYEDYLAETPDLDDPMEAVDRCDEAFQWSIDRFRQYSPRIAVPLSGGTDSRLCAALVGRRQPVTCFATSKDTGVFGNHSEINLAKNVANSVGAEFVPLTMPVDYFRLNFENVLLHTDFQTTIHTWYHELIDGIPGDFDSIVDGLGDTGFKYDYISPGMLRHVRKQRWNALRDAVEKLYRLLLVDRFSKGEELEFFDPEWKYEMLCAKNDSFARQFSTMPRNANLPVNLIMHTRFRRLIAPSVQQLLYQKFNVFSPYLGRRVNQLLWRCTPEVKADLRLMDHYFERYFPELHPSRMPSTTASGPERNLEMAIFDATGKLPRVASETIYRVKPCLIKNAVQYSEDSLQFLQGLIGMGSARDNGGDFAAVQRLIHNLNPARQVDVTIRVASFALWHRRYFSGGASLPEAEFSGHRELPDPGVPV